MKTRTRYGGITWGIGTICVRGGGGEVDIDEVSHGGKWEENRKKKEE